MPLRPLAIGFAVFFLALALLVALLAVSGLRRHRRGYLFLVIPTLCFLGVASLPVPYIFGLGAPHAVFNGPAPVPTSAVAYYLSNLSPTDGQSPQPPQLIAIQASTGKQLWQREMSGQIFITQDAGAVYAASSLADVTELFALDGTTGSVRWQRELPGVALSSPPVLTNGALVLSAFTADSPTPQQILALRSTDGQQLWSVLAGTDTANSLRLIAGPSVLCDMPNTFTLQARSISDGKLLWEKSQLEGQVQIVVGSDAVYQISSYGSVTALAPQTGMPLWQFGDHDFFHAAAAAADTLYVTAQHGDRAMDNTGKLVNPETVYALDARTGAVRWKYATQSGNSGYLAAGPTGVFIQADDGIHALRPADGGVLWHSPSQNNWTFSTGPTFIGSVIYFTAVQILPPETLTLFGPSKAQVYLYAVNAATGSLYWSAPVGPVITIFPHVTL